jgi:hypothetical protein
MRQLAILLTGVAGLLTSNGGVQAQPVEYVRVCDRFADEGYTIYIPGTETCWNPSTGGTVVDTENGPRYDEDNPYGYSRFNLFGRVERVERGIAVANALSMPDLVEGEKFGVRLNFGTAADKFAIGISGATVFKPASGVHVVSGIGFAISDDVIGWRLSFSGTF